MISPYVYDAGALIALDRNVRSSWSLHDGAMNDGRQVVVPSVVVTQVWRHSARQYRLGQVLRSCEVVPVDDVTSRAAGVLCGRTRTSDAVDALVMTLASRVGPSIVWTSDPGDLQVLRDHVEHPADVTVRTV